MRVLLLTSTLAMLSFPPVDAIGRPDTVPRASPKVKIPEPKVPDAIRISEKSITSPESSRVLDQYWQLYLEPGTGYDIASAANRQSTWERILSTAWSSSESASVVVQLVLAAGTEGSPTPERPVLLMKKKNGYLDESFKAKPQALTGYFRAVSDGRARLDVSLGYSNSVDQQLLNTAARVIENVGPALSLPAKWVTIAARGATKDLTSKLDLKLNDLLSTSVPAVASKQFDIDAVSGFELRTAGGNDSVLALISLRKRDTLLAPSIETFPRADTSQMLRTRAPSSLSGGEKTLRDIIEESLGGRATDTGAQYDSSCKIVDGLLMRQGYNSVDRAAIMAAWLVDRGYNAAAHLRTKASRGCEERLRALAITNISDIVLSEASLLEEQAQSTQGWNIGRNRAMQVRYNKLAVAFNGGNLDAWFKVADLTVKVRTDFDSPVFSETLGVERSDANALEVETDTLATTFGRSIVFHKTSDRPCFALISNSQPQYVRSRCLWVDGQPMTALLTFSGPAWEQTSLLSEMRLQRPGMGTPSDR